MKMRATSALERAENTIYNLRLLVDEICALSHLLTLARSVEIENTDMCGYDRAGDDPLIHRRIRILARQCSRGIHAYEDPEAYEADFPANKTKQYDITDNEEPWR
jgi:hypothetical protein